MQYNIKIDMDNAAFEDDNTGEIARILRELADRITRGGELLPGDRENLRDINGNTVGAAAVKHQQRKGEHEMLRYPYTAIENAEAEDIGFVAIMFYGCRTLAIEPTFERAIVMANKENELELTPDDILQSGDPSEWNRGEYIAVIVGEE